MVTRLGRKCLTHLARPARFELTTSAFGGQFPGLAVSCDGLRVVDKRLCFGRYRLNTFAGC
jgi:hypothetical protein